MYEFTAILTDRGIDLAALGGAYLLFLGNLVLAMAFFVASRSWFVISPNLPAKHYGMYVAMVLAAMLVATALENEIVPRHSATLSYVHVPHLVVLLMIHLWLHNKPEPWLIALGGSAIAAAVGTVGVAALLGSEVRTAQWSSAALLAALLGFLAFYSISTKRGFVNAHSIYTSSKERGEERVAQQVPWLGLPQWVALVVASVLLATANALLSGSGLVDIPAIAVARESMLMIAVTALVCAVPATAYWLAHRRWMPELTRFAWLVWIVVGFAFIYRNFLTSLDRV